MQRTILKSKIHRASITDANLHYEGSLTVDPVLLKAADILPNEKVEVVNINNGARFSTYVIEGVPGEGEICLNGAAARLGQVGDLVIIISYINLTDDELANFAPRVVLVDEANRIKSTTAS
jgi:aspartate 1-decarboxylase